MCFWLSDHLIIKKDIEGGFFFSPGEGSGYKESSFGNFELEKLWTTKMDMFIICNLTCGFGSFAKKSRFKSQQHIRGSGGLRSQWGCFLKAAAVARALWTGNRWDLVESFIWFSEGQPR